MYNIIQNKGEVSIEYYITGYVNGFINIIINKIENHNIYLSYSLRRNYCNQEINSKKKNLIVKNINCREKFDEGSIPELDNIF